MDRSTRFKAWMLLILLGLIWGSSFMLMKKAMFATDGSRLFSSDEVGALRMAIAGIVMLPFIFRIPLRSLKSKYLPIAGVALFGNGIPAFLFTEAETKLNTAFVGMLNSTVPMFTMIIAVLVFRNRVSGLNVLGIGIATAGTVTLITSETQDLFSGEMAYALLVIAATLCYAISINITRNYLRHVQAVHIAALAFIGLMIPTGIYLCTATGFIEKLQMGGQMIDAIGFTMILSIVGTAFSVIIFNKVIAMSSSVFASSVTYLIPLVAASIGMIMGEKLHLQHLVGMIIILTGVILVNRIPRKSANTLAD